MWVGSAYSATMSYTFLPRLFHLDDRHGRGHGSSSSSGLAPFFFFVLAISVCLGLSCILGFHTMLVLQVREHERARHPAAWPDGAAQARVSHEAQAHQAPELAMGSIQHTVYS